MTLRDLLQVLNNNIWVQVLPTNDDVIVYKPHNNQFTDPVRNFLDGNGIEIDEFYVVRVDEVEPTWEIEHNSFQINGFDADMKSSILLKKSPTILRIYVSK